MLKSFLFNPVEAVLLSAAAVKYQRGTMNCGGASETKPETPLAQSKPQIHCYIYTQKYTMLGCNRLPDSPVKR